MKRLSVRVGLAVALLVIGVTAGQALALRFILSRYSLDIRRHIVEEGVALVRILARSELPAHTLEQELGSISDFAVAFYDGEGRRLVQSRDDVHTRATLDPDARAGADAAGGRPHYLTELDLGSRTEAVASVEGEGAVRYVGLYEETTVSTFAEVRMSYVLATALVACAIAVWVSFFLAQWLRRGIRSTERVVHRIAAGDLSVRLEDAGDDEVGQLARDFNRMTDRLAETIGRLEGEEQRRTQLFASFTHEINTPLTAVLGYLESLRMPEVDGDELTRRRYVEIAFQQARELDALADDLTTLSKLDYDGLRLDRRDASLRELVLSEVAALAPRAASRRVEVRVEGDAIASVDRNRLGQVLRNVLDNAIRHAPEESAIEVKVSEASVTVRDQGPGIAPEHLSRLGEPLYRPDDARARSTGGRGLGLAIAIGLMRAHGGQLTLSSTVGAGTTVTLALAQPGQLP